MKADGWQTACLAVAPKLQQCCAACPATGTGVAPTADANAGDGAWRTQMAENARGVPRRLSGDSRRAQGVQEGCNQGVSTSTATVTRAVPVAAVVSAAVAAVGMVMLVVAEAQVE